MTVTAEIIDKGQLKTEDSLKYILAGNAIFTIRSLKTGTRYTYKVTRAKNETIYPETWFVKLLTGPENTNDYTYIGAIRDGNFTLTKASKMSGNAAPVAGFAWFHGVLKRGGIPGNVELWHEGRCGRCGHVLTVPESIASGYGPECAGRV